jgi:hypothetical protein
MYVPAHPERVGTRVIWGLCPQTPGIYRLQPRNPEENSLTGRERAGYNRPTSFPGPSRRSGRIPAEPCLPLGCPKDAISPLPRQPFIGHERACPGQPSRIKLRAEHAAQSRN